MLALKTLFIHFLFLPAYMFETMEIIDKKKISTEGIIFKQERYTKEK